MQTTARILFHRFYDEAASVKADILTIGKNGRNGVSTSNDEVMIKYEGSDDYLTIEKGKDQRLVYKLEDSNDTVIAKISDKEITFDGVTKEYYLTGENATVNVSSDVSTATTIVDLSNNAKFSNVYIGNAVAVDASGANAKVSIIGGYSNNTLKAGDHDSEIWGNKKDTVGINAASNDLLIGGTGTDTFWYGSGEGNDTIEDYGSNDVVYLYNVTVPAMLFIPYDVSNATDDENVVTVTMRNGETLTIKKASDFTGNVTFKLANGKTYTGANNLKDRKDGESSDLAYDYDLAYDSDYWAVGGGNDDLLDGDNTFWSADVADDYLIMDDSANKNLTNDINTGDVNYSMLGGDTLYNLHTGNNEG